LLPLIGEIQRGVAEEYGEVDGRPEMHTLAKLDPAQLSRYRRLALRRAIQIHDQAKEPKVIRAVPADGSGSARLLPESETRFFVVSDPDVFDFQIEANGLRKRQKCRMDRNAMTAKRFLALRT
jgi:hypothetical protein